jgi:hypothetical protein
LREADSGVERLRRELRWPSIVERALTPDERLYAGRIFDVLPTVPDLPTVALWFDGALSSLAQVQFAGFHTHCEGVGVHTLAWGLRETRKLVHQRTAVILFHDAHGGVLGSTITGVAEPPGCLSKGTVRVTRAVFNRGSVGEGVDFSEYEEEAHFWRRKA